MKTNRFFSLLLLTFGLAKGVAQNAVYQTSSAYSGTIDNTLIGVGTGTSLISGGNQNTFVGKNSGTSVTVGNNNTFVGLNSGQSATTARFNTFLGINAGGAVTNTDSNTFVGHGSGAASTGGGNAFLGNSSGSNCTGNNNTFIGIKAGLGLNAGTGVATNYSGLENVYIGGNAGLYSSNGSDVPSKNVFIGNNAGYKNTGIENIFIGHSSGMTSFPSSGSGNIFIGNSAGAGTAPGLSNTLIINNNNTTASLIQGNFSTRIMTFNVNDGTANSKLVLVSGVSNAGNNGTSGLKFNNLTSSSNTATSNGKVLTVNSSGDVVLTTDQVGPGGNINTNSGTNVTVTGNGSVATPYVISAKNIYTHDDVISATNMTNPNTRTVNMNGSNLFFDTSTSPFVDGTIGRGRIYIGNTMNFPLLQTQTTPPINSHYRLLVEGGIMTEKVKVALSTGADWADYVFADDYQKMSLNEIEAYVKENKHLPGIESAQELVNNGLDLGEMQAKQMGKIEELTLYLIEQNKKLEAQQNEIEALKAQMQLLLQGK